MNVEFNKMLLTLQIICCRYNIRSIMLHFTARNKPELRLVYMALKWPVSLCISITNSPLLSWFTLYRHRLEWVKVSIWLNGLPVKVHKNALINLPWVAINIFFCLVVSKCARKRFCLCCKSKGLSPEGAGFACISPSFHFLIRP